MNTNVPHGCDGEVTGDLPPDQSDVERATETFRGPTQDHSTVTKAAAPPDQAGQVLGDYELLDKLGAGGMGVVYRARQRSANRLVALKVIRPDRLAELAPETRTETLQRFLTEAQAAARLEHDHIVTVYDVGEVDGQPFYSMRYVEGRSLAEILRDGPLENRRAAAFLEPVARAVHYAHERGILHRDLKPSNVMLDATDRPYVADFGLAKLTESSSVTRTGQVMGTPAYMSPEQAHDASRCTPASDIYSLGATLYDLLTGRPPFRAATPVETLRQVIEQEPVAPRHLNPAIDRDLETILLKCLAKEPSRRFLTAAELADDLRRYLHREPIHARPVAWPERTWRWSRRHPAAAAAIAAVLIGLVSVSRLSAALWSTNKDLRRSNAAEKQATQDAEMKRQEAEQARKQEKVEAENAKQSEADAMAVLDFFQEKVLAAARPENQEGGLGYDATIRAAVDAAEPQIAPTFQNRPLVEASIRNTLGRTYLYLREGELAIRQLERSRQLRLDQLGPDHRDTLASMSNLASAYSAAGKLDDAMPLKEQTLEKQKAKLGPDHPDTLQSMNNLAQEYYAAGKLEQALPLFEQTLEKRKAKFGPDHPDTLISMNNLASAYLAARKFDQALPLHEKTLEKQKAKLGPDHPNTLASMNNLASAYYSAGKFDQALPLFEQTLERKEAKLGPDHPDTLASMNNLALVYQDAGKLDQALSLYEELLEKQKPKLGSDHPDTLMSMNNLATAYRNAGRLDEAEPFFREAVTGARRKLGFAHPNTQSYLYNLADCYAKLRQPEKAEPLWRELAEFWREQAGADSPQYAAQLAWLGQNLLEQQKPADAEPLLRECLAIYEKTWPDTWPTVYTKSLLGGSLLGQKNYSGAEPLLLSGYEGMKKHEAKTPGAYATGSPFRQRLTEALERLVQLYDAWSKREQAAEWRKTLEQAMP